MGKWYSNTVPKCKAHKCSDEALVTVEHRGYQGKVWDRVVKAVYIPFRHCTVEDMAVRFDVIAIMVLKKDRALIRHHVNAFGIG